MKYASPLCSCVICHETKSARGIFSHYICAHTDEGKKKTIERGRKGGKNSKDYYVKVREDNIAIYLENPKKCKECNDIIPYDIKGNTFCNHSCAAKHNNSFRENKESKQRNSDKESKNKIEDKEKYLYKKFTYNCLNCGVERKSNRETNKKYCSTECRHNFEYRQKINNWLTAGEKINIRVIKRYLKETGPYICSGCGISDMYNDKPIVLEIEHIDGNSDNNDPDNLCFLCPNCHSQTPTYKAKNKGNGRFSRRQRYKEGKSY